MKIILSIDDNAMYEEAMNALGNVEGIRDHLTRVLFKLADRGAISVEFKKESLEEKAAATTP